MISFFVRKIYTCIQRMNKITDIKFTTIENSIYLKPFRMLYKQNGETKYWDLMGVHDSVAVIIYNVTRNVLVFVKQFRPGVYYVHIPEEIRNGAAVEIDTVKYPAELGITIELCAGIVDKAKPLNQIAKEEVLEECGYDVPIEHFQRLHSYNSHVGTSGSVLTLYYCEVTDDMKVSSGGGIEDELIDVLEMTYDECKQFTSKDFIRSPGSVILAFYWFVANKPQYCKHSNEIIPS